MPLHADEIEPAQELPLAAAARPAAFQELLAISAHPALDALPRPTDVAIFQQRNEVVADRPCERILKIDDAGIVLPGHHQVARVIVAVDEHHRLPQRFTHEEFERGFDDRLLFGRQLERQVLRNEPLRQQRHFTHQHGTVVRRELGRAAPAVHLDMGERLQRVPVHRVGIVTCVQPREVLRGAEIFEQQQAPFHIHLVNVRNVDAGRFEQTGDLHIGPDVFLARRRVHDDEGPAIGREHPEIAAEAGIAGGG